MRSGENRPAPRRFKDRLSPSSHSTYHSVWKLIKPRVANLHIPFWSCKIIFFGSFSCYSFDPFLFANSFKFISCQIIPESRYHENQLGDSARCASVEPCAHASVFSRPRALALRIVLSHFPLRPVNDPRLSRTRSRWISKVHWHSHQHSDTASRTPLAHTKGHRVFAIRRPVSPQYSRIFARVDKNEIY